MDTQARELRVGLEHAEVSISASLPFSRHGLGKARSIHLDDFTSSHLSFILYHFMPESYQQTPSSIKYRGQSRWTLS
jgi:hypothetical protein